jgi:hypothetical protein
MTRLWWIGLLVTGVLLSIASPVEALKRPAQESNRCTINNAGLHTLEDNCGRCMRECGERASRATLEGGSFEYFCGPGGDVWCCDDYGCTYAGDISLQEFPDLPSAPLRPSGPERPTDNK